MVKATNNEKLNNLIEQLQEADVYTIKAIDYLYRNSGATITPSKLYDGIKLDEKYKGVDKESKSKGRMASGTLRALKGLKLDDKDLIVSKGRTSEGTRWTINPFIDWDELEPELSKYLEF